MSYGKLVMRIPLPKVTGLSRIRRSGWTVSRDRQILCQQDLLWTRHKLDCWTSTPQYVF